jgi:hypothetical protein
MRLARPVLRDGGEENSDGKGPRRATHSGETGRPAHGDPGAGNYHIREHPDIVVKDCFWRDPHSQRAGNTIDFFVTVLGMSFAQAMDAISAQP